MKPYVDLQESESYVIREFDENIDPIELKWHRDLEDRLIECIESTDWMFQFEDELPISMNSTIFIPAGIWHRTIKGTGNLIIKLFKNATLST
jgi:hypothetical protein